MEVNVIMMILVLGAGLWDMETEAVTETEEEGQDIEITCSHSNAIGNGKYFCKGDCRNKDVLIHTADKVPNGKYSIRDEGNTFYVTIFKLTINDSGLYWCGIDRVGRDTYNRVDLIVTKRTLTQENPSKAFGSHMSSTMKLLYVGASLGVLVLGLVIGLIIFIKHRKRDKDSQSTGMRQMNKTNNIPGHKDEATGY
ncbi:transmembrane domain-containing protein TMIGD3-like [Sphaeramia orbicularis]|uniref:transmembrane domain-containing protein TMIGD3-like n=1 Tax=Sphaeramia orbicularis TaxID=375764 RepID=UPI00117F6A87|nr:transmembrane domain-containing protein TMIGD3-like [Sphaeramia orbicularis]